MDVADDILKPLTTALAAFQAELPQVKKGDKAEVPTKSGGKFSYTYASLADVSQVILPALAKHGLSFTAFPTMAAEQFVLKYVLGHASGACLSGNYPLPDPSAHTPQEIGSAITYARRYALCSVTGVTPDDDDDGQSAMATRSRKAEPVVDRPISAENADKFLTACRAEGLVDDEVRVIVRKATHGRSELVIGVLSSEVPGLRDAFKWYTSLDDEGRHAELENVA